MNNDSRNTSRDWSTDPRRAPDIEDTDSLMYDEPGRIMDNIDHRSHWYRFVMDRSNAGVLLVKHGGGQERINLRYCFPNKARRLVAAMVNMPSDDRYAFLSTIYDAHSEATIRTEERTRRDWVHAFLDKRIKKQRREGMIYVRIVPKAEQPKVAA